MAKLSASGDRISHAPGTLFAICMMFLLAFSAGVLFAAPASAQNCGPYNVSVVHGGSTQLTVTCDPFGLNNPSVLTQPAHGTITVLNINSGLIEYSHNGGADVATSDSFVLAGASAQPIQVFVTIGPASTMTISPGSLGSMRAGVSFSQALSASGGVAPYTFSVVSGDVPGIILNGSTLSGTPTERGAHTLVVEATDSVGTTAQKSYGVTVANPILTTAPLNHNMAVGQPSTASITTTGGIAPYTYEVNPGSGTLPPGISLASNGSLTGTPTAAGSFTFDVVARESSTSSDCNCPFFKLDTVTITVANVAPPVANAVSATVAFNSSANPITLNIAGGAPTSVAVAAQAANGTATASGTSITYTPTPGYAGPDSFTYTATNAGGTSVPATVSITISPTTLALAPAAGALPGATAGTAYSQTFTASGGTSPYSYAVTAGALPAGLSLSGGTLSGTPTVAGTFNFAIKATDSSTGSGPFTAVQNYSLIVSVAPPVANAVSATVAFNSSANPITLNITGGAPTSVAVAAQAANGTATASGTSITYTPTPGYAGPDSFTYTATNASGTSVPATVSITVSPTALALAPAAGALPGATAGTAYSQTFTASGGTSPYSYALTAGALPAGITLNGGTGALSGTPTVAGTFNFAITATDSSTGSGPFTAVQNYSLIVSVAPPVANAVSATVAFNSSANPITLNITGGAPTSVAVAAQAANGTATASGTSITYTPTPGYAGPDSFTYTATNASGTSVPATVSITVSPTTLALAPAAGALPSATAGTAYSQTFTASGGTSPYNYALTAGALPAGLGLSGGTLSGTPTVAGTFNFAITATDSSTGSGPFTAVQNYSLAVVDAVPVANPVAATVPFNSSANPITLDIVGTATSVSIASAPPSGTATASGTSITYTPATGFSGTTSFTYTASNPTGTSAPALVTITVNVAPPIAQPQTVSVNYNQLKTFTVTATGAGPLTYSLAAGPANGTAVVSGDGSSTYTPNSTFSGTDSLVFSATGPGGSTNGTVTFDVAPPAVIADLSALSPSAGRLQPGFSASVTSYTVEVPNTTESISLTPTSAASNATITVQGQAVSSGSSSAAMQLPVGQTRIAVIVTAPDNTTTKAYEVTVRRLPPAPMAASRTVEVLAGQTARVDLTQGSTGGPFSAARIVSISDDSAGPVTIDANQPAFDMIYTSDPNYGGTLQVQYTLANPYGTSSPAMITFVVIARPDPSKDPEVIGLLTAQADSAKRFAASQIQNFNSRLEQLHDEGDRRNNSMALRLGYSEENGHDEMDEPFRELMNSSSAPGLSDGVPDFAMQSFAAEKRKKQKQNDTAPDVNPGKLAVWTGGFVNFGDRDDGDQDFDYTTVGVSAGMDYRFSKKFVAGFGFGYGRDASDIGDNGTESRAHAYSAAIYGSYSPVKSVFLDGLIGGSWLDFDSRRYITSSGDFASGNRDGRQIFGSVTASYEHRTDTWLISPYGRFDFSRSWLDSFTEKGGGAYALNYGDQTVDTLSGIVGLRMEYTIAMDWGALKPGARAEYTHDFEGSSRIKLGYADTAGLPYDVTTDSSGSDYVTLGLSLDAQLDTDWNANFDYRTTVGADNQNHAFGVHFGKKF